MTETGSENGRQPGPAPATLPGSAPAPQRTQLVLLLAAVVLMQFGYPATLNGPAWVDAYMLGYAAVIAFGIRAVGGRRGYPALYVLGAWLLVAGTWFAIRQEDATAQTAMLSAVGLFQLALLIMVFRMLLTSRGSATPTTDMLLIAMTAYLLLGGVFGIAFSLLESAVPGSFVDHAAPDQPLVWQGLLYASYVTLTTLGFGDVLAVGAWARSLVTFEAVVGTLFIAVVISRLVGTRR